MKKIYLLEHKIFYYVDENDGENVETIHTIGYFSTFDKVQKAIELCQGRGLDRKDLYVSEFDFVSRNQQYIYVLNYEFSIFKGEKLDDGIMFPIYDDFYYKFEPKTNKHDCLKLKQELLKDSKYSKRENMIYDVSKDGFYVDKIEIDYIVISYVELPFEPYEGFV